MTFRTVATFEKAGSDVFAALSAIPEWQTSELFFVAVDEETLAIGQYFFESSSVLTNEDQSYFEFHIDYHSEEKFLEWWDTYGAIHEEIFVSTLEKVADSGIIVNRYVEKPELNTVTNGLPISDFVSRDNLIAKLG